MANINELNKGRAPKSIFVILPSFRSSSKRRSTSRRPVRTLCNNACMDKIYLKYTHTHTHTHISYTNNRSNPPGLCIQISLSLSLFIFVSQAHADTDTDTDTDTDRHTNTHMRRTRVRACTHTHLARNSECLLPSFCAPFHFHFLFYGCHTFVRVSE